MSRRFAALYVLALCAALVVAPRTPVYWDSFGYVLQALSGQVGGLLLGRPLFVLASHGLARLWLAAGGSVWTVEPFLRTAWLLVAALAAPATAQLAWSLGFGRRAALLAGACVALSPAVAHTSAAVLTDAPAMTLVVLSLWLAVAAAARPTLPRALLAGTVLGLATGLREQSAVFVVVLPLLAPTVPRDARVRYLAGSLAGFVLLAALPVAWVGATQPDYLDTIAAWREAMGRERAQHPYGLHETLAWLVWLATLGPATLVAAIALVRLRARAAFAPGTRAFAAWLPCALQLVALAFYQDISFSPRYLLAAMPGALALPAGVALAAWVGTDRRRRMVAAAALLTPVVLAPVVLRPREAALAEAVRTLPARLLQVPARSAVVTGQPCPAVVYVRQLARLDPARWPGPRPEWQQVCPGWRQPARLGEALDAARAEGRAVVVDLRPAAWVGARQRRLRDEARRYLRDHPGLDTIRWR